MKRFWVIWHRLADGKASYHVHTHTLTLCLQEPVEVKVVRIFFSLLNLDRQEKIFVGLVSWASNSWLLGVSPHGFYFSLSLISFRSSCYMFWELGRMMSKNILSMASTIQRLPLPRYTLLSIWLWLALKGVFLCIFYSSQRWSIISDNWMIHMHLAGSHRGCESSLGNLKIYSIQREKACDSLFGNSCLDRVLHPS